ncbi:hypothetical protein BH09ACT12_BH09ACT12_08580 [soil metagenome]
MPAVSLVTYHAEVAVAVGALDAALRSGQGPAAALLVLDQHLTGPAVSDVLDRSRGTRRQVLAAIGRELARPWVPGSSARLGRSMQARILLLHQIDVLWWSHLTPYADAASVAAAPHLISLPGLRREGRLRFRYAVQPERWAGRGRDYVLRRALPGRRPHVAGMKFLAARPEMVHVLNQISDELRAAAPAGTPALWVNSLVRSVEHQQHLATLGYAAHLPSSHCLGYAADVEVGWFERFGAAEALREILLHHRDADRLNVIDEGRAWHLCLSPDHAGTS